MTPKFGSEWVVRGLIGLLISLWAVNTAAVEEQPEKLLGEAEPGRALVYLINETRGMVKPELHVFADDHFLGLLPKNTYTFAYVDPGEQLLWSNPAVTREVELLADQTYCLAIASSIKFLDPETCWALIADSKAYVLPTDKERRWSRVHEEQFYPAAQKFERRKLRKELKVELEYPPVAQPADTRGWSKLPAETPIRLRLIETVQGRRATLGMPVYLRVVDDVLAGDSLVIAAGTVVEGLVNELGQSKLDGRGYLLVTAVSVPALDGTLVPIRVQGDTLDQRRGGDGLAVGRALLAATSLAVSEGTLFVWLLRGTVALRLAGSELAGHTRQDVWLKPGDRITESESPPVDLQLEAEPAPAGLFYRPLARTIPDYKIRVSAPAAVSVVAIHGIDDQWLPEPVLSSKISQLRDGRWQVTFDGWDLMRWFQVTEKVTPITVRMRGTMVDGRSFEAAAKLRLQLDPTPAGGSR